MTIKKSVASSWIEHSIYKWGEAMNRFNTSVVFDDLKCRRLAWFYALNWDNKSFEKKESAYKPGSVESSHSSRRSVTRTLKQSTRKPHGPCVCFPIWSCSGWGLPCHTCCQMRGALLPHHFTLTIAVCDDGGIFSVALAVGLRLPGITWHPALWSPDFPPFYLAIKRRLLSQLFLAGSIL